MKKEIKILPFHSAGNFVLNEKRESILSRIELEFRTSRQANQGANEFIIDDYNEALAYYNKENERLFYVLFAPLPTYILKFSNQNLFDLNSQQLHDFLYKHDNDLNHEDYVGFGSRKLGIDVYAPNYVNNPTSLVEGISFAIKGYFDAIYSGKELNVSKLQSNI